MSDSTKVPTPHSLGKAATVQIPASSITHLPEGRLAKARDWLSDRFSSIMVKEARQALKSYQFFGTYTLVIVAVAAWALIVFVDGATGLQRRPNWEQISEMLYTGFCLILGVPLGIVVPFSAFRSLAKEYEDGTIQLISITTMKPRQIVIGKLGTALLQMTIYLSVVAPCIALTYMLDAISYPLIMLTLSIAIGGSVFLTILGLLLAGASRSYTLGMGISVFFVLGLGGLFIAWCNLIPEMVSGSFFDANFFTTTEGQIVTFGFIAFFGSTAILMLTAAAAQISFESDNRSTAIRIAFLVQLALFLAMAIMISPYMRVRMESLFVVAVFCGHFWLIAGSLMVGERPELSQRVQRSLPKSVFWRSFVSLLMPGPGRGFLFAIACMAGSILAVAVATCFESIAAGGQMLGSMVVGGFSQSSTFNADYQAMIAMLPSTSTPAMSDIFVSVMLVTVYPIFYLSLTYLTLVVLRASTRIQLSGAVGPLAGLMLSTFFVFTTTVGVYTIWYNLGGDANGYRYSNTVLAGPNQLDNLGHLNWYLGISTMGEQLFDFRGAGNVQQYFVTFLPVAGISLLAFLPAFVMAIRELRYLPSTAPEKVQADIKQEQAERSPKPVLPKGESLDEIFGEIPKPKPDKK